MNCNKCQIRDFGRPFQTVMPRTRKS